MAQPLIEWVSSWPPEIATMFLAMLPVTELRASIPVGIGLFGLDPLVALGWSVLGDIIPVPIIYIFLSTLNKWLTAGWPWWQRVFTARSDKVKQQFTHKYQTYGLIALTLFVSIPLPGTGAWTGTLAAWLFGIPFKKAFPFIVLGAVLAGIIVTAITTGAIAVL